MVIRGEKIILERYYQLCRAMTESASVPEDQKLKKTFVIKMERLSAELAVVQQKVKSVLGIHSLEDTARGNDNNGAVFRFGDSIADTRFPQPEDASTVFSEKELVRNCLADMKNQGEKRILELRFGILPPTDQEWDRLLAKFPHDTRNPITQWPKGKEALTLREIGVIVGLTRERVRQLESRAIFNLKQMLLQRKKMLADEWHKLSDPDLDEMELMQSS
jgi:RNA polymerase sigma factor (sigma-70 family)